MTKTRSTPPSCHDAEGRRHRRSDQSAAPVWFRTESDLHPTPTALLTVPEACDLLRVSKWTLYRLNQTRQLATIKIGARRLIPPTAVQELVDRLRTEDAA